MERLVLLVAGSERAATVAANPDLYLVSRGEAAEAQALVLARQWRRAGLAVELDLSGAAFAKQFKRADRSGARWAAVIGESEASEGVVVLKDLRAKAPQDLRLSPEALLSALSALSGDGTSSHD
jgi:histidyl-tRNA synthetase